MVEPTVSISTIPHSGLVEVVDMEIVDNLVYVSALKRSLFSVLIPKCSTIFRGFVEPNQRLTRFQPNNSFFRL